MRALQNLDEFAAFTDILKREGVRSYLEIGSKFGGSLKLAAHALPRGSLLVSVDLPGKDTAGELLDTCNKIRRELGHRVKLLISDSHDPNTVKWVSGFAPFDAAFIDGDHSFAGIEADWNNYGPMAKIVAFHDISWKREYNDHRIEVPKFWEQIKVGRKHQEIRFDPLNCGIGIIWAGGMNW